MAKIFYCETQISKTNNLKVTIGVLKFASRTIPHSGGYNTPPLEAELGSRACPGVHTHDWIIFVRNNIRKNTLCQKNGSQILGLDICQWS
jgi:hypothetical protein